MNPEVIKINPALRVHGELTLPGDKSIWHRALILGAMSNGETVIEGADAGFDVAATADCLNELGVEIGRDKGLTIVKGVGTKGFRKPKHPLYAQNSGTTVRLLAGMLSAQNFNCTLDGDTSLRRRPMMRIVNPLTEMGADITTSNGGVCPIRIRPSKNFRPFKYDMPMASAQVKSAILIAGICGRVSTSVTEPGQSRDHTERMLGQFGAEVKTEGSTVSIDRIDELTPAHLVIPGDFSSAAFMIAAAMMIPGSDLLIRDVGLNPTRTGFLRIIGRMGADVTVQKMKKVNGETFGDMRIKSARLKAVDISFDEVPITIDELPLIGILAASAEGRTEVRGAAELRVKESDRIAALVQGMTSVGIHVEEFEDGFAIEGPQRIIGGRVNAGGDHRIAMAFATAALASREGIMIDGADAVAISYPAFYEDLGRISER